MFYFEYVCKHCGSPQWDGFGRVSEERFHAAKGMERDCFKEMNDHELPVDVVADEDKHVKTVFGCCNDCNGY